MIVYDDIDQKSPEWFRIRAGRPTASEFDRIISPAGKSSPATWHSLAIELIAESIRPDELQWAGNRHTDRGNVLEAEARRVAARHIGEEVAEVGFVTREDGVIGCSPDGLIRRSGESGAVVSGIEIKCPSPRVHIEYLLAGTLPEKYAPQVHGSMCVTGLSNWYFVSYCPGMRPFILRVERDDYTKQVEEALDKFLVFYAERRREIIPQLVEVCE